MTAPKIDTQAPELNIVFGRDNSELPQGWTLHLGDGAVHYRQGNSASSYGLEKGLRAYLATLADLSAAREAAAWIAGRDAAVRLHNDLWRETAAYKTTLMRAITPPRDPTAALDRLIAERVRDAVEAEREACAKIADELSTQWWSDCKRIFDHHTEGKSDGADDIANAIRARGSKEGRDG